MLKNDSNLSTLRFLKVRLYLSRVAFLGFFFKPRSCRSDLCIIFEAEENRIMGKSKCRKDQNNIIELNLVFNLSFGRQVKHFG